MANGRKVYGARVRVREVAKRSILGRIGMARRRRLGGRASGGAVFGLRSLTPVRLSSANQRQTSA